MNEKNIIIKLLEIIDKREELGETIMIWKCRLCNAEFNKKPWCTRHMYCVHEGWKQTEFKVSEVPDHPHMKAIFILKNPTRKDTEQINFLRTVRSKYGSTLNEDQEWLP